MATIYDVAKRAGVSITTVSRVLNGGNVSRKTREAVERAIAELKYVPNAAARTLPSGVSRIIAAIVPDISNPYYSELVRGVQDVCDQAAYGVMIWSTDGRAEKEESCLLELSKQRVDGVVMVRYLVDEGALHLLDALRIPIVLAGMPSDEVATDCVGTFGTGNALRTLIDPLVAGGRSRLAHIAGPEHAVVGTIRRQQYLGLLEHYGLEANRDWLVEGDFTRQGGRNAAHKLLSAPERPDIVFAANDMMAIGFLEVAEEMGVTVPDDVAVIGCDDIYIAGLLRPALSSVHMPKYELGRRGAELLLDRMADPTRPTRHLELEATPVARESTAVRVRR